MKTNEFTTLLWDVDGTLLDFSYSEEYAIRDCFESFGLYIDDAMIKRYSQINLSYWKKLELGLISKQELLVKRFLSFFAEYNITNVDVEAFRKRYQTNLGSVFRYLDNSFEILKMLSEKGKVKQYVVTNGVSAIQRNKMHLAGFDNIFEKYFISDEIGAPKPQKEFFMACLGEIKEKDKNKILIIGDSLTSDIKGGVDSGIKTCWFNYKDDKNSTGLKPNFEIHSLKEILNII